MAFNDSPDEKRRAPDEIRGDLRRFLKRWHTDLGADAAKPERSEDIQVLHVLTLLASARQKGGLKNLSAWPKGFKTGMRIVFPDRAIFLPKTPEEFFDLLDYIERRGTFPQKEYPPVEIVSDASRLDNDEDGDGENEGKEDTTLLKFANFISTRESIPDLLYALDLKDMYGRDQLASIQFTKRYDERAYFLFVREAWKAKTLEEIRPLLTEIEERQEFKFYSEETRAQTLAAIRMRVKEIESGLPSLKAPTYKSGVPISVGQAQKNLKQALDRGARRHFVERLRDAHTHQDLDTLEAEIKKFPFFNRGELGVVNSVLSRKRKRLGQE